jgi:L-amino acid N-acyltransferase YncA
MQIRQAGEHDLAAITAIFNYEVEHSAAIWVEKRVTVSDRRAWLAARQAQGCPVLVAEQDGEVLGFGAYGPFRPYEGFRNTVEHLVYIAPDARGKGVGRALLAALIDDARQRGKTVIVGAIDAENDASLALHRSAGFVETGRMNRIGEKWGRRRTMVLLQKELTDSGD